MTIAALLLAASFTRTMERVSTMDPAMARSVYDTHAIALVYEAPLEVDYKARPYRLAPGFCELPEVSADGLTYVFRLRGRKNGSGASLGAEDMVRSLERLRDPDIVSPNAWIVKDVDTMRAVGAGAVEMRLKRRCHYFPWLMAMSATAVRGRNGEGSGAYELSEWWRNHEMVFKRREKCVGWNGFDTVRYLVVDDASTQWLMFLKGELDYLGEIARDNWDSIVGEGGTLDPSLSAKGIRLHAISAFDVMHLGINMKDPLLGGNRKLRQALNAAFDYPAWEKFYNGRIVQCDGPVPPGVGGRLETPFRYAFDLKLAKRLLAEAGYPDGIDPTTGRHLTLTMSIGRASQESREAGELTAAFYEKVGIRLELDFKTWDAFLRAVNEGRVQLFRMGWVGDYPDAQNFLQLFYSKNASPGPNHAAYSNPDFDREYEAALDSATDDERNKRWFRCQEIIREDCPWVFTHYNKAFYLTRPTVGNFVPTCFPDGAEKWYEAKEN